MDFILIIRGEVVHMKAHLLCCCADAPARAAVQGIIHQHGGAFCCNWCLHPAANRKFASLDYVPDLRTQEEIVADGSAAMVLDGRDNSVNGVTGLSPLLTVKSINIVDGMILEYFHATAHGIAKTLLSSYTSIPLLTSTLRPRYLQHWAGFVQAMHYLLQEIVREDQRQRAEELLTNFGKKMELLYPDKYLTYNLHTVTSHLAENCQRWGPAWSINGYSFENGNKILKGQIHANLGIASQVCRAQSHSKSLDILETQTGTVFSAKFRSDIEKKNCREMHYHFRR